MDDDKNVLNHLAIIMDGNSRWAKANSMTGYLGHKKGLQRAKETITNTIKHGIKHLTLFAFSSENWQRPKIEVNYLISLLNGYIDAEGEKLNEEGVKLVIIGDLSRLDVQTKQKIHSLCEKTKNNQVLNLYIAFSYGGKEEILNLVKNALTDYANKPDQNNEKNISDITFSSLRKYFYAPDMPDVDLLIRTANQMRISNFLPMHLTYAELLFLEKYWPDFTDQDLIDAIAEFKQRKRTFGRRLEGE